MELIEVVASPAERWALFEVVFQKGDRALRLANGAEGRAFRSFVDGIGLAPIRETLARFGSVSSAQASNETSFSIFQLTPESVQLYREKIADLPRSALHEVVGGGLFSSLHGLGGPFHREGTFALPEGHGRPTVWARELESWAPEVEVSAGELDMLKMRARPVQDAIENFQQSTEDMEMPFPLKAAVLRFHEAILLATKDALELARGPVAVTDDEEDAAS